MKEFKNIAELIRRKRHATTYSQAELSYMLGYKNGQFISNVERGLCSVPAKKLNKISELLSVDKEELIEAILTDKEMELRHECFGSTEERSKSTNEELVVGAIRRQNSSQLQNSRGYDIPAVPITIGHG